MVNMEYHRVEHNPDDTTSSSRFLPSVMLASSSTGTPLPTSGNATSTPAPLSIHSVKVATTQLKNSLTTYYTSLPPAQQEHLQYAGYTIGGVLLIIIIGLILGIVACKSHPHHPPNYTNLQFPTNAATNPPQVYNQQH